jgi:hypothetical protein
MPRYSLSSRTLRLLPVVIAFCTATSPLAAAPGDLFAASEPLSIRIEGPIAKVVRRSDDPQYEAARLLTADEQGVQLTIDLRVRARGRSRVTACDFPPLLLNFPGKQPSGSPFDGQNRLKLVTHCNAASAYEQYVLIEQQLYRALNLLTDKSLRIRPVKVTYYDSERERELVTKPGFLIEDEQRFADRLGVMPVALERIDAARYDAATLMLLDTFQYFIGNTDWSAAAGPTGEPCCHNVVPFARGDGVLLPVPYDFDSSGIVGAPYTLPDERLPIRTVRQRLYRGRCREQASFEPVFDRFIEQRAAIAALFSEAAGLSARNSASAVSYIDEFYATITDPRKAQRAFQVACPA